MKNQTLPSVVESSWLPHLLFRVEMTRRYHRGVDQNFHLRQYTLRGSWGEARLQDSPAHDGQTGGIIGMRSVFVVGKLGPLRPKRNISGRLRIGQTAVVSLTYANALAI